MNTITVKPDGTGITVTPSASVPVWGSIAGTLSDQTDLQAELDFIADGPIKIDTLADISQYLNGSVYELPADNYLFRKPINWGTSTIDLITTNGIYVISGANFTQQTYTGTTPWLTTTTTGVSLIISDIFITSATATAISLSNGNSLIMRVVVFISCERAISLNSMAFLTGDAVPMVGCENGMLLDDVQSINMYFPQWNSGPDSSGVAIDVLGSLSERMILTAVDSRPQVTESFLNIQATYAGDISVNGGVHDVSSGGVFFDASGRDGSDPDIDVQNVKNVTNSKAFAAGHVTGNSTETVISISGTAVKINVGSAWTDVDKSRFTFNASGTWTYIGKETISKFVTIIATIDPVGGGTDTVSLYITLNGVPVATSKGEAAASTGSQVSALANITLSTNDTLEAWVANDSDTSNLVISTAAFDVG